MWPEGRESAISFRMADHSPDSEKKRPAKTARHRVMDLLARRDHSEKELRDKLSEKFEPAQVEDAISFARESGWLVANEVLVERFSAQMHRRNKGVRAINHKLKKIGLPGVKSDFDQELEKAVLLAESKWTRESRGLAELRGEEKRRADKLLRERIGRFLLSRGFEPSVVRKVVYEKL